jgi:hypothetical protein
MHATTATLAYTGEEKEAREHATRAKETRVLAIKEALSPKDRFVLESQNRNLKSDDRIACSGFRRWETTTEIFLSLYNA